jgi:hypothetical protein
VRNDRGELSRDAALWFIRACQAIKDYERYKGDAGDAWDEYWRLVFTAVPPGLRSVGAKAFEAMTA